MGQQVSVETFASSADTDGFKYWTSFDPYPFKVGSRKMVYMGLLNGDGPLRGQKCVVKTVRDGAISRRDWFLETKRARVARQMAVHYNHIVPEHDYRVTFSCPIMAEIDTLSDCMCVNDVLGKPKKKWKESENVSIELYLKGRFENYEYGWVLPEELIVPEAFSHYTWCRSEGNLLVSNLQGISTSKGYHFTGPTVHSEEKEYGSSDLGFQGIKGFFMLHKCNHICKHWPRLGDGVDLRGWGEFIGMNRLPTAPPIQTQSPPPPPYMEEDTFFELPNQVVARDQEAMPYIQGQLVPDHTQTPRQTGHVSRGNGGFVIDWREQFMNQCMYGMSSGFDFPEPMQGEHFQNQMFGMQLMWIVKQMGYTSQSCPPPPYCLSDRPRREIQPRQNNPNAPALGRYRYMSVPRPLDYPDQTDQQGDDDDSDYFHDTEEKLPLLPPPYSEESVDPKYDSVTYL